MASILGSCCRATCCIVSSVAALAASGAIVTGSLMLKHAATLNDIYNQCCIGDNIFNKDSPCPNDSTHDREAWCTINRSDHGWYVKWGAVTLVLSTVGLCLVGGGCCVLSQCKKRGYTSLN